MCRFDAVNRYIKATYMNAPSTEPFGIRASSEGTGSGPGPLGLYNAGSYIDMYVGTASTPDVALLGGCENTAGTQIKMGCDPSGANNCGGQDSTPTCDGINGQNFIPSGSSLFQSWTTPACGNGPYNASSNPTGYTSTDVAAWTAGSIELNSLASFSYPKTNIAIWICCPLNETCGLGQNFWAHVMQKATSYGYSGIGGQFGETCLAQGVGTGGCDGESAVYDGTSLNATYTTIYKYMETITKLH